jgi:hypothetical protein
VLRFESSTDSPVPLRPVKQNAVTCVRECERREERQGTPGDFCATLYRCACASTTTTTR